MNNQMKLKCLLVLLVLGLLSCSKPSEPSKTKREIKVLGDYTFIKLVNSFGERACFVHMFSNLVHIDCTFLDGEEFQ